MDDMERLFPIFAKNGLVRSAFVAAVLNAALGGVVAFGTTVGVLLAIRVFG